MISKYWPKSYWVLPALFWCQTQNQRHTHTQKSSKLYAYFEHISHIKTSTTKKKQPIQLRNGQRASSDSFQISMTTTDEKGSMSLATRKTQIKTTVRYKFTPVRVAKIQRVTTLPNGAGQSTYTPLVQSLWKTVWRFPYNPGLEASIGDYQVQCHHSLWV